MDSKPRRGRKPKSSIVKKKINIEQKETPIITHLPITIECSNNDEIFIKNEDNNKEDEIKRLKKQIKELRKELNDSVIDSDKVYNLDYNDVNEIKCWWCRNEFCTPVVTLPENVFNNKFQTFGHFCSYNCALAYNIEMNDENISKRTSLLHHLYKKTYNESKDIIKAPDWKILKEYGGIETIEQYRKNFIFNTFEYQYLKPPLISRINQIEKTLKNRKYKKKDEYVLKRSKPLNTSKYTLESTMGLKKIINVSSEN